MYDEEMTELDSNDLSGVASHVWGLVETCENYLSEQSKSRDKALEYHNGEMKDMPPDEGRTTVVSRDSRSIIKKVKPSIMRTFFGNDRVVTCLLYTSPSPRD